MTARQIADIFETIAPIASGNAGDELGFVFGDSNAQVRALACVWQCHVASLEAAVEMGLPVIETLHSISEMPAIYRQAQMMAARLPDIPVYFVMSGALAYGSSVQAALVKGSSS